MNTCFSQQITRKNKLTSSVLERYQSFIGTNKEVRQGLYQALYNKTPVASGMYTDDKRTGMWHFYSKAGTLVENYNYDTNTLTYEAVEDTTSALRYFVDAPLNPGDRVTKPIKIGGRYFAYIPYLKLFKLPSDMPNTGREGYTITLELLISPLGRLADFRIHVRLGKDEDIMHANTDLLLKDEDKQFIPATLNNQPVACRIMIHCYLNPSDQIDMY